MSGRSLPVWALAALVACGGPAPEPEPAVADPAGEAIPYRIYVTNEGSGDLTVIAGGTHDVLATVPLGKRPRGVKVAPDGTRLFVALSGSPPAPPGTDESTLPPPDRAADGIGVVDLATERIVTVIRAGTDPEQVAVSADGTRLYVANEDGGALSVVDIATGEILANLPVGGEPEGVRISPNGVVVYVTSEEDNQVSVIDTALNEVIARFDVGARPRASAFSPDSARAYVSAENGGTVSVVDTSTHTVTDTVDLSGEGVRPMGVVVSPDGSRVYVTSGRGGTVIAIDAATLEPVGSVDVGTRPWGIAITPDGRFLYTANGPSNDVSVIDVESLTVVETIAVGERPWGVAIVDATSLPMPAFHHIHINSVDPERALDWWTTFWPAGERTTVAGFPAFTADGVSLVYTAVDTRPPGAFDPTRYQSIPQSPFWTTGPDTDGLALYQRLTALDPEGERFGFLPVFTGPDESEGVPHSGLAPFGDQLLTVSEMAERASREGATPTRDRTSGQDFGYLVDPDGILVEFNGNATTDDLFYGHTHFWHEAPLCAANWYVEHLGMQLPPRRDENTGALVPRAPYDPCAVEIGEVSYPTFLPVGQLRRPIASVRLANAGWAWYTRQCRDGRCGDELDRPLAPSRGQVVDHVGISYPDLDVVLAHLEATGVPIVEGPYAFGETRAVLIEDLDGMALELIESP